MALFRFVWEASWSTGMLRCSSVGVRGEMLELARDQVTHGDEVLGGAVPTRSGLGCLHEAVDRLHIARVAVSSTEGMQHTGPVCLDRVREALHELQSAAPGPAHPMGELGACLLDARPAPVALAQRFLHTPGAYRLQIQAVEPPCL